MALKQNYKEKLELKKNNMIDAGLVKKNKKSVSGKIVCNGKSEDLLRGHASIAYEVSIQYNKTAK